MIVEVNGIDQLISERAYETLNTLLIPRGSLMCEQSSADAPHWGCTREREHTGPHVAHGESGRGTETYAVFTDGVLTTELHRDNGLC